MTWEGKRGVLTGYVIVSVAALACSATAFFPHLFAGHDLEHALYLIDNLAQGIAEGRFPVYLHLVQAGGAGYAMGVMYPSLFYVPAALLHVAGMSLDGSYQALLVMVNVATGIVAFWSFRRILDSGKAAMAVALLWVLAPYRLENVLLRAAVAEAIALVFFPLLAYGVHRCLYGGGGDRSPGSGKLLPAWVPLGIAFSGIVLSHVVSVVILVVIALPVALVLAALRRRPSFLLDCCKAAVLVVALTAWFVVPFLDFNLNADLASGSSGTTSVWFARDAAVNPLSLLLPFEPMAGESTGMAGLSGHMPVAIGWGVLLPVLAGAVTVALPATRPFWRRDARAAFVVLVAAAAVTCFLATNLAPWATERPVLSAFFWLLAHIQFPWRLLGLGTFLLLLAGALFLDVLCRDGQFARAGATLGLAACLAVAAVQAAYAIVSFIQLNEPVASQELQQPQSGIPQTGDIVYLPRATDRDELLSTIGEYPKAQGVEIGAYEKRGTSMLVGLSAGDGGGSVTLPLVAYPHYEVSDGSCVLSAGENGLLRLDVPAGFSWIVEVAFVPPPAWTAANAVSLVTLLALVAFAARRARLRSA